MEEEIAFASDRLAIAGTLTLPAEGTPPFAAALFIGGSGPVSATTSGGSERAKGTSHPRPARTY